MCFSGPRTGADRCGDRGAGCCALRARPQAPSPCKLAAQAGELIYPREKDLRRRLRHARGATDPTDPGSRERERVLRPRGRGPDRPKLGLRARGPRYSCNASSTTPSTSKMTPLNPGEAMVAPVGRAWVSGASGRAVAGARTRSGRPRAARELGLRRRFAPASGSLRLGRARSARGPGEHGAPVAGLPRRRPCLGQPAVAVEQQPTGDLREPEVEERVDIELVPEDVAAVGLVVRRGARALRNRDAGSRATLATCCDRQSGCR
jgi:hypothetical protein